ncbi:MAG: 23S rRNA (uracil(1939)-C(5))-methyltransferase RlmD [Firmicutes bacterium]|nr:23S rRNA (uracil(1939)-C(5))-methyltransferase RlmD [Bacillota bacterium]
MCEQIIELDIIRLNSQGDGVGRYNGLAVFVPGALPGEKVRARLSQAKKNYAKGILIEIIEQAAERVLPACPLHLVCGGCVLRHLAYEAQLYWKNQWLEDALQRIGGIKAKVLPILEAKQKDGYRNRVQLHVHWRNKKIELVFYNRGSKEAANCAECLLMHPVLLQIAQTFAKLPSALMGQLAGLCHVAIRCDSVGAQALLTLIGESDLSGLKEVADWLIQHEPRLIAVWANWGKPVYGIYGGYWHKLFGVNKLPDNIGNVRLQVSAAAFTQVNPAQTAHLYQCIKNYADLSGKETVLDIYSGVGAIALNLANTALMVTGIEEYAPAVADARINADLNNISNCRFIANKAEKALPFLLAQGQTAQVAILDPARAGCAPNALHALAAFCPKRIVYASCNPATLARDARVLAEYGYIIDEVQPLDMFPYTEHVEAIALFQQRCKR